MNPPRTMHGLVPDASSPLAVRLVPDLSLPDVRAGEILVRVTHTTVNGHEFHLAQKPLVRAMAFLSRARGVVRTGLEFAGVVVSDGARFRSGDRVMGYAEVVAGVKPHAEYVAIPEAFVAAVPESISMAAASTLPMSGMTALGAVRDVAKVERGQSVLVIGATGGVGVLAVQLAHLYGAEVTAVASTAHHDRLRELGAQHVVDYRETPIAKMQGSFDAILEFSDTLELGKVSHLLGDAGVFVPADPMRNLLDILLWKQARYLLVDRGDTAWLEELAAWVDDGKLVPVLDQVFAFDAWKDAVARGQTRGRIGRTVLSFEDAA